MRFVLPQHGLVFFADIRFAVPERIVDHIIIDGCAELPHELLPDGQHALVGSVFLRVAFLWIGFPVADGHDVHGTIADVTEHGRALEFRQLIRISREALREDVAADNPDAVGSAIKAELHVLPLDQVFAEAVLLLRYPGQGQPDSQVDIGALRRGEITQEAYDQWRYCFPAGDTTRRWVKIPPKELIDYLTADLQQNPDKNHE